MGARKIQATETIPSEYNMGSEHRKIAPTPNNYSVGFGEFTDPKNNVLEEYLIPNDFNNSRFICSADEVETDMAYQTVKTVYDEFSADMIQDHIAENMKKLASELIKKMAMMGVPYHLVTDNILSMIEELYVGISMNGLDKSQGGVRNGLMNYMHAYLSSERTGDDILTELLANDYQMNATFQRVCIDGLSTTYSQVVANIPNAFKSKQQGTSVGELIEANHLENSIDVMGHGGVQSVFWGDVSGKQSLVDKVRGIVLANYFGVENIATIPVFNSAGARVSSFYNRIMSKDSQNVNNQLSGLMGMISGGNMGNNRSVGQQSQIQQYQQNNNRSMGMPGQQNQMQYQGNNRSIGQPNMAHPNKRVEFGSFSINKQGMQFTAMEGGYDQFGNIVNIEGVTVNEMNNQQLGNNQHQLPGQSRVSPRDVINGNLPEEEKEQEEDDGLMIFHDDQEVVEEPVRVSNVGNRKNVEDADFEILD